MSKDLDVNKNADNAGYYKRTGFWMDPARGWILWSGGECPVPKGTMVEVCLQHGYGGEGRAELWNWDCSEDEISFVAAYRVFEPNNI